MLPEPVTSLQAKPKRAVCMQCMRAQRTCICGLAVPIHSAAQILILQHPLEVHQAKGTGRLLHLCLAQSRIVVGEQFDEKLLHSLLYDPWPPAPGMRQKNLPVQPVLLYPPAPSGSAQEVYAAAPQPEKSNSQYRLILLDGTWRKSRKMLHRNPLLAQLPRLSLANSGASRYTIRKAHRPEQLSTLEAACYALMELERDAARFPPLLEVFEKFMAMQVRSADSDGRTDGEE